MNKLLLTKRKDGSYIPYSDVDYLVSNKVEIGYTISGDISDARNVLHHRKFMKLLKKTLYLMPEKFQKRLPTVDALLVEIKLHLGYYDVQVTEKGTPIYVPRSINFLTMGQKKFEEFYNDSFDCILKHYLRDISKEQFENELSNF
jgi:hypothetical protein